MFALMHIVSVQLNPGPLAFGSVPFPRPLTEASVASRSQRAGKGDNGLALQPRCSHDLLPYPAVRECKEIRFLIFLPRQETETAAPAQGAAVAPASSFNPRTAFGQSVAQLERQVSCAPNSNRCQSLGLHRELVFVRMS
jgi:hypothetical protein